jgi:pimeloyl-ACP methyl ester carboxylesterase
MGEFLVDAGFRVVAPSRPGYLDTPLTDDRATPAQQAALHAALLDALGVDRFALACWSGGGPSSYQLAIDHPERVTAVAAIAAVSKPYTFEHTSEETILFGRPGTWLMKEMAKHSPKQTVKMLVTEEGDLPKDKAKELVAAIWEDEARRDWVLRWLTTVTGARKVGFANDRKHFPDLQLDLAAVAAPVLLVHADTDSDVGFEHSDHAAEVLPEAELHTIHDGTHISAWTGPDDEQARQRIVDHLRAR